MSGTQMTSGFFNDSPPLKDSDDGDNKDDGNNDKDNDATAKRGGRQGHGREQGCHRSHGDGLTVGRVGSGREGGYGLGCGSQWQRIRQRKPPEMRKRVDGWLAGEARDNMIKRWKKGGVSELECMELLSLNAVVEWKGKRR
uniref:Uncharacterized protein n=1 Tax=Oryza sativa subsp. japonica TaxID=39947 RepID=Q6ZKS5_ORYSJ|nr:hypothetical protein [Oryza sativa Japonica Group]